MFRSKIKEVLGRFVEDKVEYEYKMHEVKKELLNYIQNRFRELFPNNDIEIEDVESLTRIFAFEVSKINGNIYHSDNYWISGNGEKVENIVDVSKVEKLCSDISIDLNINLYLYRKQSEVKRFEDIVNVADYLLRKFTYEYSETELAVILKFCPKEHRDAVEEKLTRVLPKRRCSILKEEIAVAGEEISKSMYESDLKQMYGLLNYIIAKNNDKHIIGYKVKVSVEVKPFGLNEIFQLGAKDFQLVLRRASLMDEEFASMVMFADENKKDFILNKILFNISSRKSQGVNECIKSEIGFENAIYRSAVEKLTVATRDLAEQSLIAVGEDEYIKSNE